MKSEQKEPRVEETQNRRGRGDHELGLPGPHQERTHRHVHGQPGLRTLKRKARMERGGV